MPQHKWDDRKMALHCIYLSLTWFLLEEETMGAQGGGGKHILRGAGVPPPPDTPLERDTRVAGAGGNGQKLKFFTPSPPQSLVLFHSVIDSRTYKTLFEIVP